MAPEDEEDLRQAFSERAKAVATMMADSALLLAWAGSTWVISECLGKLNLSGDLDTATATAFQWIFSVSTLVPVLGYTIVDISKVVKHVWKEIRK